MSLRRQPKYMVLATARRRSRYRGMRCRVGTTTANTGVKFNIPLIDFTGNYSSIETDVPEGRDDTGDNHSESMECSSSSSSSSTPTPKSNNTKRSLVYVASTGDWEELQTVYDAKRAATDGDDTKCTSLQNELNYALVQAVTRKNVQLVQLLFEMGAKTDGKQGDFVLYPMTLSAVQTNSEEMVDMLIQRGLSFANEMYSESTALHAAARIGNATIMKKLLDLGQIDVNRIEKAMGAQPLHVAVQHGQNDCVKLLIGAGADVNSRLNYMDRTSLHLAAMAGNDSIVKHLLENGAEVQALDSKNRLPWFDAVQNGHMSTAKIIESHVGTDKFAQFQLPDGQTLLQQAVQLGNVFATEYLIDMGCDVQLRDSTGKTLLILAVINCGPWTLHIVKKLLKNKLCSDSINEVDNDGKNALTWVLESPGFNFNFSGNLVASALIKAGADVNHLVNDQPIIFEQFWNQDKRKFLLKHGANLNYLAEDGTSLLWLAASHDGSESIECLLDHNIDMSLSYHKGPNGNTPFIEAFSSCLESAKLLYHSGCSLNGFRERLEQDGFPGFDEAEESDKHFVNHVISSGRACNPLSLWDFARQTVLRCFGQGDFSVHEPKVQTLGLPVMLTATLSPKAYRQYNAACSV